MGITGYRCRTALRTIWMAGTLTALASGTAAAQEADFQLEEIIVTAQKIAEPMQDTPIAITAVTGDALEQKGLSDIQQIAAFTPNITFDSTAPVSGASSGAVVFIRGVGQTDFALTTEAGVGTYVDGVYMSRSIGGVLDVLDVERIEVLRGPQGTLFGRNTIGGAISIISRRPKDEFSGTAQITAGSRERLDARVSVDIPLSETVQTRIAASSKNRDGFVKGLLDQRRYGDENRDALRGTLRWQASDKVSLTVTADKARIREQNAPSVLVGTTSDPGSAIAFVYNLFEAPVTGVRYDDATFVTGSPARTYATGPNGTRLNIWGAAATLDWDLDAIQAKSITAFRRTTGFFNRDADGSPLTLTHTENFAYRHEQFSQELQVTGTGIGERLKYAIGAYYFEEEGRDPLRVTFPASFGHILQSKADVDNNSYAAYAQGTFEIMEDLSATGGLRYTRDRKNYIGHQVLTTGTASQQIFGAPTGTAIPLIPLNSDVTDTFENWSPRFSLERRWSKHLMTYLSYSKGFKSGGFNIRYVQPRNAVLPFSPEKVTAYEAGFKVDAMGNRLRLNGAAFHSNYRDIQVVIYEGIAPLTQNAGRAEIRGGELEIVALPLRDLELSGSVGYIDAGYKRLNMPTAAIPLAQQITLDKALPNTPEWSLSGSARYTVPVFGDHALRFQGDWSYTSTVENDAQNSRFLRQPGYHKLNASVTLLDGDDRWDLRAFVDNLTDKRVIESGDSNFGIGFHEANYNRPREWGLSLTVRY